MRGGSGGLRDLRDGLPVQLHVAGDAFARAAVDQLEVFDDEARGFFWLVGQGGYGIQTSPALGQIAAALACGEAPPIDEKTLGARYDALAVERFRN